MVKHTRTIAIAVVTLVVVLCVLRLASQQCTTV